jgi:hypothetical protein
MSPKGLAVKAAEMVGSRIVEKGADKAIKSLPPQKQNKFRGWLMVGVALMLFISGLKLIKNERRVDGESYGESYEP